MESRLVEPYCRPSLHQFVGIAVDHIRCEGDITLGRDHDLHLNAPFDGPFQCFADGRYQGEVGVDDTDGVLGIIDGLDIQLSHDLVGDMRFTVDDAHHLITSRFAPVILRVGEILFCGPLPDTCEDDLQVVDDGAFQSAVHVAPFTHLFCTYDVIVGHVHSTGIGNLSVDDYDFTMVTRPDMVDPGESDGVVFHDVDTVGPEFLEMMFLERLVVGVIAKAVEHGPDLDAFLAFLPENVEEQRCDGVIAEVEVFQVNAALGLSDGLEHIRELVFARHEQFDVVALCEVHAEVLHLVDDEGVARLC